MAKKSKQAAMQPIKIGIAGIGRAGWSMHCAELKNRGDKFQIVAACDIDRTRLELMAETYGCIGYNRFEDLVQDPAVELVSVATISPDHTRHALLALKAGKYVFLEKPIALTYADAKKLATAAQRYPGKLFFRHNRRFESGFVHIQEIIASGILGEVYEIKLRRQGYQRRDDWQTLTKCGGGQLNNWGPHIIDHALQFLESPVQDQWSDLKRVAAVGDAEDHLKIVLRGANGRIVDLEISGGVAISEPEYIIFGSKGALTCKGDTIQLRYLDPKVKLAPRRPKTASPPLTGGFGSADQLVWKEETVKVAPAAKCETDHIWDYLYAAIREGKPFPITTAQAVEVVRITELARIMNG